MEQGTRKFRFKLRNNGCETLLTNQTSFGDADANRTKIFEGCGRLKGGRMSTEDGYRSSTFFVLRPFLFLEPVYRVKTQLGAARYLLNLSWRLYRIMIGLAGLQFALLVGKLIQIFQESLIISTNFFPQRRILPAFLSVLLTTL